MSTTHRHQGRTAVAVLLLAGCLNISDRAYEARFDNDSDGFSRDEDCDDADPNTWPGAPERCDDVDQDCDGVADDNACVVSRRSAGPGESYDLFISSLDGGDERQLTDTPTVSEMGAVPSPDRSTILYVGQDHDWYWMDRDGNSAHCISLNETIDFGAAGERTYDRISGLAWFQSDQIVVNRGISSENGSTSGTYLADLHNFDGTTCSQDHPMFSDVGISGPLGDCCAHQITIMHAFSSCPGDFVVRGLEENWEPRSDLYRFSLSTWEFGPLHEDEANGDADDYIEGAFGIWGQSERRDAVV